MRKNLIMLMMGIVCSYASMSQSIYGISFNNIDGGSVSLSSYAGKRIVFVIAPVSSEDSIGIQDLKKFHLRYKDSITIVGVMSIENGYSSSNNAAIKTLYQNKGIDILLTAGMHTKKAAGSNQSGLMKFLTDSSQNKIYNVDAKGIWHKFFIDKNGNLSGVVNPNIPFSDNSVGWILFRKL